MKWVRARILEGTLDPQILESEVADPGCGAVLLFVGNVRNLHEGKAVREIDYQAYRPMALRELQQVGEEAADRFEIPRLLVDHRLGLTPVGQASLVVAAAAPHRAPVFHGVLWFVDEMKRRVPIWKKEFGPDGHHWVGGVLPGGST